MLTHGRPIAPRRRRLLAALALAVGAAAALIGGLTMNASGGVRTDAGSAAASRFVLNMAVAPATLDPAEACGFTDITVMENTYMRLTRYGSKPGPKGTTQVDPGHMVPYFATSWKITNGGKTYTFKLRPGLKFPSGKPINSAAVKYSFNRSITMGGCGGYFIYDGIYTPPLIKSMATPNPTTFVVNLSVPDANVLQDWAQPAASIIDKSVIDAHGGVQKGKVNTWMAGQTAGIGPFTLKSYEANKQAVLTKTPGFFAPAKTSEMVINWIPSDPTLLLQARSGAADVTLGLAKQSVHSLASNSSVKVIANDTPDRLKSQMGSTVVEMNLRGDGRAERAVALLSDRFGGRIEREGDTVRINSDRGTHVLFEALRSLDGDDLEPDSLTVREPSIDDVFLALTGHHAEPKGTSSDVVVPNTSQGDAA